MGHETFITTRTIFSPQIAFDISRNQGEETVVTGKHVWNSNLSIQSYQ